MYTWVNPLPPSYKSHPGRPPGLWVVLGYAVLVAAWCLLLQTTDWPAAYMWFLSIPIFLVALRYPRPIYTAMTLILAAVALWSSFQISQNLALSFWATVLAALATLALAGTICRIITAQKQAEARLRRRNQELTTVASITRALNATLNVERAFPAIVEGLRNLTHCDRVSLVLFDDERQQLTVVALDSPTSELGRGEIVPYADSPAIPDVKAGRAHLTPDLAAENDYPGEQALYQAGFRSRVNLPLIVSEQVIGALNLTSRRLAAFTPDDLPPLQQTADALAAAIVNSQLHKETTQHLAQVRALSEASTHLAARLEQKATLDAVVEQARAVLGADRVAVYVFDWQANRFSWVRTWGLSDAYMQAIQRHYPNLPGFQVHMGQTTWVERAQDENVTGPLAELAQREGYHTLIALPLQRHDLVTGGLSLYFDQRRAYNQALLDLAQTFANQVAVALENARLFEHLRTTEARYRALFEDSTDPIAMMDARGNLLDVNPAACDLMGQSRQDLLGRSASILSGGVPEERFRQALEQILEGEAFTYEFSISAADGKARHFQARVERIDYKGESVLQWIAHDVTHQRDLDHWREELTGIIVHNLRNPLTWVKSGTEMALMFLPPDVDPDVPVALDTAIKGADRLEQQIDVLLNINRAEAGQELTDQDWLSAVQLAQEVIELLGPRAVAQKVQLQGELPASLPLILGNRNMLALTLENLVENAIKYSPPGETIHIRAQADHSTLRISVSDRGPGVPPGERERIFEKFYQVRRRRRRKGAGMGLYFCKLAVEAHGGKIWVEENSAGEGSTFVLTLPLQTDAS
jgi:NtrC-family two-component system sensor histidine kinase KinB